MVAEFDLWLLLAGIALFLFAMTQLEAALQALGGRAIAMYLRRQAGKRWNAVIGGVLTTAFLQSSSVVGLMVLAFTGAGLLTLPSALAIVFGSNLGTTATGWIVATLGFKLEIFKLSMPLIAVGGAGLLFGRGRWIETGRAVLALGLLLLGLNYMKESVAGLEALLAVDDLAGLAPWQYLLFGVVVAAVIQSSSATMMLTLAALNAGIVDLPNAAAVVIGADLGTTTTVLLGALKGSAAKKRVALGHVIFNSVTDIIAFALRLPLLATIALFGLEDPLYSLVAFHSLFNLLGLAIFLPLTLPFARLLERLIKEEDIREARYLSEVTPTVNEAALTALDRETARLIERAIELASRSAGPDSGPHRFDDLYRANKKLAGEIVEFAVRLQAGALEPEDSQRLEQLLSTARRAIRSTKAVKDVRHNLLDFAGPASEVEQDFRRQFIDSMKRCGAEIRALNDDDPVEFEELARMVQTLAERHAAIHEAIFAGIRDGRIDENLVTTLLNVNLELMNCQHWLILALGCYHLSAEQADGLEQIPVS